MFVLLRDQAFFKTLFFSGDRPGDLSQVKTPEILRFPDNSGLLFNHVWGKTLRDGSSNLFAIRRNQNADICPVKAIDLYVTFAKGIGIDITSGFYSALLPQMGGLLIDLFHPRRQILASESTLTKETLHKQQHFTVLDRVALSPSPLRARDCRMLWDTLAGATALLRPIICSYQK